MPEEDTNTPDEDVASATGSVTIPGVGQVAAHPELVRHVATLGNRWNELNASYQQQRRLADQRLSDIKIIAELLREEAEKRDWCSEYGDFVDEVNSRTSEYWLEKCAEEHVVSFEATISGRDRVGLEEIIDEFLRDRNRGPCTNFRTDPVD